MTIKQIIKNILAECEKTDTVISTKNAGIAALKDITKQICSKTPASYEDIYNMYLLEAGIPKADLDRLIKKGIIIMPTKPLTALTKEDIINHLSAVDNEDVGDYFVQMLMDTDVTTYDMYENLLCAYYDGSTEFKAGMDAALNILLWYNMTDIYENVCSEYIKEE